MAQQTSTCKECGWHCKSCVDQTSLHLHVEIENLKQRLLERERHIVTMETNFLAEADKFPNGELAAITEELLTWQEKYSRLYESYKRVQKVNQNLEDKLLKIVDKCETEKNSLIREVASLTQRLVDARGKANRLQNENERYRNDVNLAIQLLQCKPANFVSQKYDTLPSDLQQKVLSYMCGKRRISDGSAVPIRLEMRTIKVPVSTSPPSSMVYSVNKTPPEPDDSCDEASESTKYPVDIVSAAIMAKVLAERERERMQARHCETCRCPAPGVLSTNQATQTLDVPSGGPAWTPADWSSQGLVRYVDSMSTRSVPNNRLGIKTSSIIRSSTKHNSHANESQSTHLSDINYSVVENETGLKSKECTAASRSDKSFKENSTQYSEINSTSSVSGNSAHITALTKNGNHNCGKLIEGPVQNDTANVKLKSSECAKVNYERLGSISCVSSSSSKESPGGIVNVEVSTDGRIEAPSSIRSKNNVENQNRVTVYHAKSSSEGSIMKIRNREGRSYLAEDAVANEKCTANSSWARYPSSSVKPTETGPSKLVPGTIGANKSRERSGLRLCSLRVQTGTSNILLDNATAYQPVLYTSRHEGVSAAVLVHAPRARSGDDKVAHWLHTST